MPEFARPEFLNVFDTTLPANRTPEITVKSRFHEWVIRSICADNSELGRQLAFSGGALKFEAGRSNKLE